MGRAKQRKQQRHAANAALATQPALTQRIESVGRHVSTLPPLSQATRPSNWPVLECLVSEGWQTPGEIVQVVVARQSPEGAVAVGSFLVDLGCLGVKDAFAQRYTSLDEYDSELRAQLVDMRPMVRIDLNLAAKIVREGLAYARSLGFRPHKDMQQAEPLLNGADPDASDVQIPLGQDGQPLFVSGPYDNARKIMETLNHAVGEGNYHFVLGGPDAMLFDEVQGLGELVLDLEADPPGHKRGLLERLTSRDDA